MTLLPTLLILGTIVSLWFLLGLIAYGIAKEFTKRLINLKEEKGQKTHKYCACVERAYREKISLGLVFLIAAVKAWQRIPKEHSGGRRLSFKMPRVYWKEEGTCDGACLEREFRESSSRSEEVSNGH